MDKSPKRMPKAKKKAEANKPDLPKATDETPEKAESGYSGRTKIKKGQPRSLR